VIYHFQSLLPTDATFGSFHGVGTGVELCAFETSTNQSIKIFVFAGLAGSPKQLVVYPRGAADDAVTVGHKSESPE
jgi:hypothetical protein